MYIDHTYIMSLSVLLACADRVQTGIQSFIYMKGQDFSFVYQFGYTYGHTLIVLFFFKAFGYFNLWLLKTDQCETN